MDWQCSLQLPDDSNRFGNDHVTSRIPMPTGFETLSFCYFRGKLRPCRKTSSLVVGYKLKDDARRWQIEPMLPQLSPPVRASKHFLWNAHLYGQRQNRASDSAPETQAKWFAREFTCVVSPHPPHPEFSPLRARYPGRDRELCCSPMRQKSR